MKTKKIFNLDILLTILPLATIAVVIFAALFFAFPAKIAHADSGVSLVYPSSGYFQAEDPTLIAANADYLLVYDKTQKRLYSRSNTALGNYDYALNFSNANELFAVGDKAFFVTDDGYFALDLTDKTAEPKEVTFATPNNISYFTTDGEYLFVKSSSGNISIYNSEFQIAFGQDDAWNDALTGHHAILGNDSTVYIFSSFYGVNRYTILDLLTEETQDFSTQYSVSQAAIGDVIFALTDGKIACLNKADGSLMFETDIAPDAFSAYGKNLFVITGKVVSIYMLNSDGTALTLLSELSMAGGDTFHFDKPVDIEKMPTKFAVADANNNRIAYFENSSSELSVFTLDTTPKHLAHDGNILYIACENQILKLNSLYIEQRYEMTGVKDILYLDKLYVLKDDGIYVLFSGEFVKLFEVENAICLSAPEQDGTNVFVATEDEIIVIDGTGNKLPTTLTGDFSGLKDMSVDYAGNVVLAYETKAEVFKNNISSLDFVSTHPLDGENRATLTSCILVDSDLYFTANESYVAKLTLDVVTKDAHTYPVAKESGNPSYFEKSGTTYTLPVGCRNANIKLAAPGVLLAYKEAEAPEGYYLAYDGTQFLYIPKQGFNEVTPSALSGEYVATKQTILFVTPNKDSQANAVIEEETHVLFKQKIIGFDGDKWVVVEYDGKEYFATASDFSEYVPPEPERKHTYGRAKGTRVGGIVNVYQSASTESAVILEIADGAKLEILETLDDFYKVSVNGTVGYMTKDEVQLGGLTTVQIVSIILAILVLLAGSTVFVAIYFTKKKQTENE